MVGKKLSFICGILIAAVTLLASASYGAWWNEKEDESSSAKTTTVKRTVSAASSAVAKKAIEDSSRTSLKGKEWTIYLHDRDGGRGVEADSLTFTDETVNSKNLEAKGYPASNFGLFVNNDGSSSWETMKTNPATKDKVFLRGELRGSVMTGTVFMKPVKGKTSTYIFSTINPATAVTAPATTATTTTKQSKK